MNYDDYQKYYQKNFESAVFVSKLRNDTNTLLELRDIVWKRASKKEVRNQILKELGIWRIR